MPNLPTNRKFNANPPGLIPPEDFPYIGIGGNKKPEDLSPKAKSLEYNLYVIGCQNGDDPSLEALLASRASRKERDEEDVYVHPHGGIAGWNDFKDQVAYLRKHGSYGPNPSYLD